MADHVTIVSGASRGIGAATARRLAADGHAVVLAARTESALETVAADITEAGGTAYVVQTDVTDPDAVDALVEATLERFGRVDAAVVNAGVGERRNVPLEDLPLDEYHTVRGVNVDGAVYTTSAVVEPLRETGGTLVFVGSYMANYPSTSTPIYAASKWFLRGFAKSMAGRLGPDGVAVSLVNPSGVPTAFGRDTRETTNADRLDPAETLSADDVADAIASVVEQDAPGAVTQLDLYRRDIYERF